VLACAALLPDLVTAAALLAGLARFDAKGCDWSADMNQDDVEFTGLCQEGPGQGTGQAPGRRPPCGTEDGLARGNQGWWDDNSR
jgi:hypothetical protein